MFSPAFMEDRPVVPLSFEDGLRLLDARRQLDADEVVMDSDGEGDPMDVAIVTILIGDLLRAVCGYGLLQFSKDLLEGFV
jgi:hypothetical protein